MKVSLNWLKELSDVEILNINTLTNQLTQAGFEVENVESITIEGQVDHILDISSTANRSDVLSMIGLSREISALTGSSIPSIKYQPQNKYICRKENIISSDQLINCCNYFGAIIDNITINDSPNWLKHRLYSCGFTNKNLLEDISNFIMLKWGQPINIIDFNKVACQDNTEIRSDFYCEKDNLIKVDNKNIELNSDLLVTQVNNSIIGIAGIGINNHFDTNQDTKSIFIESAIFKQSTVRKSSRTLNIRTESSVRQERGLNTDNWQNAYIETLSLITDLAGGNIREIFYQEQSTNKILSLDLSIKKVHDILGPINYNGQQRFLYFEEIQNVLTSLGFDIIRKNQEIIKVTVPNYRRKDVFREIDIIEEIARIYGYHKFTSTIPNIQFSKRLSPKKKFIDKSRSILRNLGLTELVHYSLAKSLEGIALNNPLIKEYSNLRCSLLEGLIESNLYNIKQSNQTIDSFEIGTVFNIIQHQIVETTNLAVILGGNLDVRSTWSQPAHSLNWYEAKGIIENFFQKIDKKIEWVKKEIVDIRVNLVQQDKSATLIYNNKIVGIFSELNQITYNKLGINTKLFVLEVNLNILEDCNNQISYLNYQIKPYSKYPSIIRDISLIVPQNMEFTYLLKLLDKLYDNDLESIKLFDQYQNKSIGQNKKSIGLRFTYRSNKKTLTNFEIDKKQYKLKEKIIKNLKLKIRQ
nr:phenylalanyl-tRNA synthetase beta chain [Pyropia sp. Myanmar_A]BED43346.1 phenylalanyl-tRNA synthetase beta chain [Pyropia sp. Myanmar_B]BED43543.1 phenylalanyl-tRNA synthetase beta chain [Pyropia sp. Myanmar_C]